MDSIKLRSLQLIQGSLALGIVLMAGMLAWIAHRAAAHPRSPQASDLAMLQGLTLAHGLLAATSCGLAFVVFEIRMRAAAKGAPADPERRRTLAEALYQAIVIRAAILEGPALLGMVTCLIGAQSGALFARPAYLANAATAALFLLFCAATFPTPSRMDAVLRERSG